MQFLAFLLVPVLALFIHSTTGAQDSGSIVAQLRASGLSSGTQIFLPSDRNYTQGTVQRYTIHDAPTYVASIKPVTVLDVQKIVRVCSTYNVSFLATGGGHGFATTFGKLKNGIQIDLGNFNNVTVDKVGSTMTIGGAVRFKDVFEPLWDAGKEIQTGSSGCVGMVGATLGGGVGRYNGLHGMILDALQSMELVTASGDVVIASRTENAELFWGMRGAGMNYGIVVSAVYQVYNLTSERVMNADMIFPINASSTIMKYLKSFEQTMPANFAPILLMGYNKERYGGTYFLFNAVYVGPMAEGRKLIQPLIDGRPIRSSFTEVIWRDLVYTAFFGAESSKDAPCPELGNQNVYGSSIKTYNLSTWERYYTNMDHFYAQYPNAQGSVFFIEHFSKRGVQAVPDSATAYPHRDITAHLLFNYLYSDTSLESSVNKFAREQRSLIQETSGFDELQVYVSYGHGDEGLVPLYGKRKLPRLRELKARWDPKGLFNFDEPL